MSIASTGLGHYEGCRTYSVEQAAKMLGVGRNSAYEAARRGEIPVIKIGNRLLVPKTAFDRLLNGPAA